MLAKVDQLKENLMILKRESSFTFSLVGPTFQLSSLTITNNIVSQTKGKA